jgi:hypothetical protein
LVRILISKINYIGSSPISCENYLFYLIKVIYLLKLIFINFFMSFSNFFYWCFIKNLKNKFFSINLKKNKKRLLLNKQKFKKLSNKKQLKKTKTTLFLKIITLNYNSNIFLNNPPLNTILNLLGVNTQKFCDDINKDLIHIIPNNILLIVRIFIKMNLTYNYLIDINYNYIIKNLNSFDFINNFDNLCLSSVISNDKINILLHKNEEIFFKRFYFNFDFFLISNFIFLNQFYFFNINFYKNTFLNLYNNYKFPLFYEKIINNILSIIRSYNLNLILYKVKYV